MPETAAAGPISKPEQLAREMLSESAATKTWLGAADAAAALARIYGNALPPPAKSEYTAAELAAVRPFCLVYMPDNGLDCRHDNSGVPTNWAHAGEIVLELEQTTPAALRRDAFESHRQWANTVGAILADLQTIAGQQTHLALQSIRLARAPFRNHPRQWPDIGDCQAAVLQLQFGTR